MKMGSKWENHDWDASPFIVLEIIRANEVWTQNIKAKCKICGSIKIYRKPYILRYRSCGCAAPELISKLMKTHGFSRCSKTGRKHRVYGAWLSMRERCMRVKSVSYPDYGGRGITVCDRWKNSFEAFIADMGEPPEGKTLGRIDNNGNYCKENCEWQTPAQQARNKRNTKLIEMDGQLKTAGEWEEITGIGRVAIRDRISRGWPPSRAITEPVSKLFRSKKRMEIDL